MDNCTSQQRSANMVAIHGKSTKPEMVVRKWLWGHGYRYRLNHPRLPGEPDIVMRKYRTCIFINGCFWHGHNVSLTPTPLQRARGVKKLKILNAARYQRRTGSFGGQRFEGIRSGTRGCNMSWLQWAGTASPSGNVS